jgi:hypothetical protein
MMNRMIAFVLGAALAAPAWAQTAASPLPLPPQLEKELAARASEVSEVTLDRNALSLAANYMKDKSKKGMDEGALKQLVAGLDDVYVRNYEFAKGGEYSLEEIEKLRQTFKAPEWISIVHTKELKSSKSTDILVKQVNGQTRGIFILSAEPKELSIVLILGPIRMDQLGALKGLGGLGALGNSVQKSAGGKAKAPSTGNQ